MANGTKEALADALRQMMKVKPIDKITVKDIITNCGYSQATFYRQFRDKYDLIAWSYTRDLESILDRLKGDVHSWRQTLESAAAYFSAHRQYLANLLTHTSGYDSFIVKKLYYISCKAQDRFLSFASGQPK